MNNSPRQGSKPQAPSVPDALRASEDGAGLGLDIVRIERMERVLERTPGFRMRVFTESEREYCDKSARTAVHYATRFAAKQAVLKSMGKHIFSGIALRDIEIVRLPHSRPVARLHGRALAAAKELGVVEVPVSLSFTHDEAVAFAMAITSDSVPEAQTQSNPVKALSSQFKEARSLLDDLPVRKPGDEPRKAPEPPAAAIPDSGCDQPSDQADAAAGQDLFGSLPGI